MPAVGLGRPNHLRPAVAWMNSAGKGKIQKEVETMTGGFKKIVCCTDFSKNSHVAFEKACYIASWENSYLYVLHVIPLSLDYDQMAHYVGSSERVPTRIPQVQDKAEHHLKEIYMSKCSAKNSEAVVKFGSEVDQIVKFSEGVKADLIVIGARGIGYLEGILGGGSVAEGVVKASRIPVLVVHA